MSNRLRLRRSDGQIYLERWGWEGKYGGVFLHRMSAPDPGPDLHDHPWTFVTIPLVGEYRENRADIRKPGYYHWRYETVRRLRPRLMRLDECHQIIALLRPRVWTLVFIGPRRRVWGFYTDDGWVDHAQYEHTNLRDVVEEKPYSILKPRKICPNCHGVDGLHSGMDACPPNYND